MRLIITLILALLITGPRFQPESLAADLCLASCGHTQVSSPAWTDAANDDCTRYINALQLLCECFSVARAGALPFAEAVPRIEGPPDLYTLHLALLI